MTDIKNKDILFQISDLLKDQDAFQKELFQKTLQHALIQHNTGKRLKVEEKLYEWIDAESRLRIRNEN